MQESCMPLEVTPRTSPSVMIFLSATGICVHICKLADKVALGSFKELLQKGESADFAKNLARRPLIKTYRMTSFSPGLLMDSTYPLTGQGIKIQFFQKVGVSNIYSHG